MNGEMYPSNENLSQLRNLQVIVEELPLLAEPKRICLKRIQHLMKKIQIEQVEIEQLKYILTIKLQIALFKKDDFDQITSGNAKGIYNKIISIEQSIKQGTAVDEKIIAFKIIIVLLEYKLCMQYQELTRVFSFQELVEIVQEYHLWQMVLANNDIFIKYFLLGLIFEYISKRQVENFKNALQTLVGCILKQFNKEKDQVGVEQKVLLLILLHCQLSFKLLKKHLKFEGQITQEQSIYCLFYAIEDSVIQKTTYQYKKYNLKTEKQAFNFIKDQILSLFNNYEVSTLDNCLLLAEKRIKSAFTITKSRSLEAYYQSLSKDIKQERHSAYKVNSKVKIKAGMFIPQKINYNNNLKHKIQFKKNRQGTELMIKNNAPKLRLEQKKQCRPNNPPIFRMTKQTKLSHKNLPGRNNNVLKIKQGRQAKVEGNLNGVDFSMKSYNECKNMSLNKNYDLQYLLCLRPSGKQIQIEEEQQKRETTQQKIKNNFEQIRQKEKRRQNKKLSIGTRAISQKVQAIFDMNLPPQRHDVPPEMKTVLQRSYFTTFMAAKRYYILKQQYPFYEIFMNLCSGYYVVKGKIVQIVSVQENNLNFQIRCIRNQQYQIFDIDLKKSAIRENIQFQFINDNQRQTLFCHFRLGKCIYFYRLGIKTTVHKQVHSKNEIQKIKHEGDIYCYNIYTNANRITTQLIRRILSAVGNYIHQLNEQTNINFHYSLMCQNPNTTNKASLNNLKLQDFYSIDRLEQYGRLSTVEAYQKSMSTNSIYFPFATRLLKDECREQYYLIIRNTIFRSCSKYYYIISCKKIYLQHFFRNIRTLGQLKQTLVERQCLMQREWKDVMLNRRIIEPPLTTYIVKNKKKYLVYTTKQLIQHQIVVVMGSNRNSKWFFIIDICCLQKDIGSLRSNRTNQSNKKIREIRKQLIHKRFIEIYFQQQMKFIRVDEEKAFLGRFEFRVMLYEYSWTVYIMGKYCFCFKMANIVLVVKVSPKRLIYIRRYPLSNDRMNKEQAYEQFRGELVKQHQSITIAFAEINGIVQLFIRNNQVVANIECENQCFRVVIQQQELTCFRQIALRLNLAQLTRGKFRTRIIYLIKEKLKFYDSY